MGRQRLLKLNELKRHTLECACGEPVVVHQADIVSVKCCYCATGYVPIRSTAQLIALDNSERELEEKQKEQEKTLLVDGKKRRGRPKGVKNKATLMKELNAKRLQERIKNAVELSTVDKLVSKLEKEEAVAKPEKSMQKRGRGRPRKTPEKKGKTMDNTETKKQNKNKTTGPAAYKRNAKAEKKVKKTAPKGTGKRGRKSTVGVAIMNLLGANPTGVKFEDILSTYSNTRQAMGKQDSPAIEERNCRSTLYIMKRDSKILELEPKKVYAKA